VRPRLPARLEWIELRNLHVGQAIMDIHFQRREEDGTAQPTWTLKSGELQVFHTTDGGPDTW
jgi:hypothetical protein